MRIEPDGQYFAATCAKKVRKMSLSAGGFAQEERIPEGYALPGAEILFCRYARSPTVDFVKLPARR
jgi:hypothetical protein